MTHWRNKMQNVRDLVGGEPKEGNTFPVLAVIVIAIAAVALFVGYNYYVNCWDILGFHGCVVTSKP